MPPAISIIIVTYNARKFISACLDSLAGSVEGGAAEVIVVDNSSTDGTAGLVAEKFPWVMLLCSGFNGGFSHGNNMGIERARGAYYFFLNPDAHIKPGCLERLLAQLESHPRLGCVAPAINDDQGRRLQSYYPFTGLGTSLWAAAGLNIVLPLSRLNGMWRIGSKPAVKAVAIDRASGAAMMVKRAAIDEIGRFDERFFLYSEEEDLCMRLWQAGWEVLFQPEAEVVHTGGGSTGARNPLAVASANNSRLLYMFKHHPRLSADISRLVWIIALAVRFSVCGLLSFLPTARKMAAGYWLSIRSLTDSTYFERKLRPKRSVTPLR